MSHNLLDNEHSTQTRRISKARVIAGFMGEIDAAGAIILVSATSNSFQASVRLACEFKVPFETSTIKILDQNLPPGGYSATALFAGQRIMFGLDVLSNNNECKFPDFLDVVDLRSHKRRRFGPEIQAAEIATRHGIIMATPIDISQNSVALIIVSTENKLSKGELVKLKIRGDTTSRDIFSFDMVVNDINVADSIVRITLGFSGTGSNIENRRTTRHPIDTFTLALCPLDDHLGGILTSTILDISLTGCQCKADKDTLPAWLTPGVHLQLKDQNVTATIMWVHGGRFGLRIDALDDATTLTYWSGMFSRVRLSHGIHQSQLDELVNLFTQTGLLKGNRRKLYGANPLKFLPPERMEQNSLLYHRIVAMDANDRPIGHLSMSRFTDDLWYFQEGAHTGDAGTTFRELYAMVIESARNLYNSSKSSPRYLSGLYHANIKSAGNFGQELYADKANRTYPMFQVSIDLNKEPFDKDISTFYGSVNGLNASDRRNIFSQFDPILTECFAGWNGDHPRLNAELSKLGPSHSAETLLLSTDKEVWGLAYRLKSYYALNATGVMNSLFLIVKASTSADIIKSGISQLLESGFTFGTDDVAIIVDKHLSEEILFEAGLQNPKPFTFFVIDSHLNKEFLGAKKEPENPQDLRQSKKSS